jgi:hypothetical protein
LELNEIDYQLLKFIRENENVHIDVLRKKFNNLGEDVDFRIESLKGLIHENVRHIYNEAGAQTGAEHYHTYKLSNIGKKRLKDYEIARKEKAREKWKLNIAFALSVVLGIVEIVKFIIA